MADISMKLSYKLRKDISEKINKLPLKYFDTTKHGDILSRVTNDVDTLSQTLNQTLMQSISSTTIVIGVLIMMLNINWLMTVVALVTIPLFMVLVRFIVKFSQKYFKEQQDSLGNLNGHVEEMYGSHIIVKAFNGEKKSIEKFNTLNNTLYNSAWKSQFLSSLMMPIMTFIGNINYVAICVLGGWLAIRNTIGVGDIQAFIQYSRTFTHPIAQLANISNVFQQTAACAERVFEFLEEKEIPDKEDVIGFRNIPYDVKFSNISFGYNSEKTVINNFSASIKEGQKIAIVGPTGAGKSTIVKLLMRFYDVNKGEILIGDENIKSFSYIDLRSRFGMVLQDAWLYNETIMENIRYGRLDASDKDVIKAAKAAYVDTFVSNLPDGYNMILNEETSNISEGQKQLITIARVILKNPKILILDEATSSIDTRTEVLIQKAMDNLMENRTSFIIAHRLSTIRNADLIIVMDKGDIVEQGTHEELLQKKGFYANLYNSQFEAV